MPLPPQDALPIITSPSNDEVKRLRALHMRKYRQQTGWFLSEGLRHCMQALECGFAPIRLAYAATRARDKGMPELIAACQKNQGRLLPMTPQLLARISGKNNPQMVIAAFPMRHGDLQTPAPKSHALKSHAPKSPTPKSHNKDKIECWVALDRVRDPGNLGTIMRTAEAVGARGVILIDACTDPYSVEAVRASMGAIFCLEILHATNAQFADFVRGWDGQIIGTSLDGCDDYYAQRWHCPLILLMGNEQSGLTPTLAAFCTDLICLPMRGASDSLNLAVATGICLYEVMRASQAAPAQRA